MTSTIWVAVASIIVTLLLAGLGYLIKGMFATGELTRTVTQLSESTKAMTTKIDAMQKDMLTQTHLELMVAKLKLELIREGIGSKGTRESDKS